MGWRRKSGDEDPLAARQRELDEQIRRLEKEIQALSRKPNPAPVPTPQAKGAPAAPKSPAKAESRAPVPEPVPVVASGGKTGRSGRSAPEPAPAPVPVAPTVPAVSPELDGRINPHGVRKFDLTGIWRRFRHHFKGPSSNNPRMVQYLAAGSVHGLRPLRYEKRVARNRFIGLFVLLVLILFGLARVYFPTS